ncbi:hypothetical protein BDY21DRAFT_349810 [Lineolata rhizophorae]|uniref:Uncharacterized protein n=1 Tax=Lineolata rhizophorae TaxID=578093 RepID=A0A6A6NV12_9PEZI|nr:hypothetical protein BDY21DRAFT_349810 [Lineolata rhizophorae]
MNETESRAAFSVATFCIGLEFGKGILPRSFQAMLDERGIESGMGFGISNCPDMNEGSRILSFFSSIAETFLFGRRINRWAEKGSL